MRTVARPRESMRKRWARRLWPPGCGEYHSELVRIRARYALPATACFCLLLGGIAGAGTVETIYRTHQLTYERAVYILDVEPDSADAALAQARLKALVGVACATLARQAASGGTAGADAARFLRALREELPR